MESEGYFLVLFMAATAIFDKPYIGNAFKIATIGFDANNALFGNIIKAKIINALKANVD